MENEKIDDELKMKCTEDICHIHNICLYTTEEIIPATLEEVQHTLKKLKPNTAVDSLEITCEHLIFGGSNIVQYLHNIVNYESVQKQVPAALKEGLVYPIFKKEIRQFQRIIAELQ